MVLQQQAQPQLMVAHHLDKHNSKDFLKTPTVIIFFVIFVVIKVTFYALWLNLTFDTGGQMMEMCRGDTPDSHQLDRDLSVLEP